MRTIIGSSGRPVSTVTIKLLYVIMYMCQNFGVSDVLVQIPKSIYQASYFCLVIFLTIFFQACSYLIRMKDC